MCVMSSLWFEKRGTRQRVVESNTRACSIAPFQHPGIASFYIQLLMKKVPTSPTFNGTRSFVQCIAAFGLGCLVTWQANHLADFSTKELWLAMEASFPSAPATSSSGANPSSSIQTSSSPPSWPGIPVQELGHPLVQKSTNFVSEPSLRQTIIDGMDEFLKVYEQRPDPINMCGIRIPHALAVYWTVKLLQPTTILESGVNAGQSTYFLRAAANATNTPTKIYAFDPLDKPICGQEKRWIDTINTEYLTGQNFVDIEAVDWASKIKAKQVDPSRTLVFLDDHLVVLERLGILYQHGFRHVLVEDNYKTREGATPMDKAGFTPKQLFARVDDDSQFLWYSLISYAEFPTLVAPLLAKANPVVRKKAGGFMVAVDTNTDIVEPILNEAHIHLLPNSTTTPTSQQHLQLFQKICQTIQADPDLKDDFSYQQFMSYNNIAYFEMVPLAPRLRKVGR